MSLFAVETFGPVGSFLVLVIFNTSVHTHSHIHAQTEKQREKQTRIQTYRCKQKLFFFYQIEEYKTALLQCILKKLYGVTTALEKSNTNIKRGIKFLRIILQSLLES